MKGWSVTSLSELLREVSQLVGSGDLDGGWKREFSGGDLAPAHKHTTRNPQVESREFLGTDLTLLNKNVTRKARIGTEEYSDTELVQAHN